MKAGLFAAALLLAAQPAWATVKDGVIKWRGGDYRGAVADWLPYAARGDADALFDLGQAYKLGRGVPADAAMAQSYFLKSAIKGHSGAQERLGLTLFAQAQTRTEGARWLTQAAAQGEDRAQYALGIAYFNGDGLPTNRPLAYAYMRRAEKAGLPEATPALAAMLAKLTPAEKARGDQLAAALPTAPQTAPAPAAPPLLAATDEASLPKGSRVQIGAFASRAEASEVWTNLTPEQKALAGDAPPLVTEQAGIVRLQLGPFRSQSAAKTLCAKLQAAGRPCFVVRS